MVRTELEEFQTLGLNRRGKRGLALPIVDIVFFAVMMFLALAALLEWKRRRTVVQERLSRNLREFVHNTPPAPEQPETEPVRDDSFIVVR